FGNFLFYRTNDAIVENKVHSVDSPQVAHLSKLYVKKGDTVSAGQQLATITLQGGGSGGTKDLTSPVDGSVVLTAEKGSILTSNYPVVLVTESGNAALGEATVFAFVEES